jgi:hypothetical protein
MRRNIATHHNHRENKKLSKRTATARMSREGATAIYFIHQALRHTSFSSQPFLIEAPYSKMSKPPRASNAKRCRSSICVVQTKKKQVQATLIGNALTFVYRIAVRPDTHPTVGRTALEKAYRKLRTIARLTFLEFQRACEATLRPILGSTRVSGGLAALSKVWRQLYVESAAAVLQLNAAQQKEKSGVSAVAAVSAASDKQVDAMDVSESPAQVGTASMSSSSGLEALLLAAAAADKDVMLCRKSAYIIIQSIKSN